MRVVHRRLTLLLVGSSVGAVGWGAVLPFLYADVADAHGLGASVAAGTFTAFALGALVASPMAGRLADRSRPLQVATVARLAMVVAIAALALAGSAGTLWVAALAYGAALAVVQPSTAVLVLGLTPAESRRNAFAWQFIGQNLGLAAGGVVGGFVVDLTRPDGSRPAYVFAAACSVLSALLVLAAAKGRSRRPLAVSGSVATPALDAGYRAVLRTPAVRWLLAVTVLLTLACYAQFDSGLPAYALSVLDVAPSTLGIAVGVNTVLVAILTAPVVRATRAVPPAFLLATCGVLWIGVWVVFAAPLLHLASPSMFVVAGYAMFSVGETMLAPVLTPLAATLAPAGATGRTLAAVTGAQTLATAVGPGLSGLLLGLGAPLGFVAMQIGFCLLAVWCALRLGRVDAVRHRRELAVVS